jgi:protein arginine kinase
MLHLPALVITKQISGLIVAVQKLDFVVRDLFGEDSEGQGHFFSMMLALVEIDILSRLT